MPGAASELFADQRRQLLLPRTVTPTRRAGAWASTDLGAQQARNGHRSLTVVPRTAGPGPQSLPDVQRFLVPIGAKEPKSNHAGVGALLAQGP